MDVGLRLQSLAVLLGALLLLAVLFVMQRSSCAVIMCAVIGISASVAWVLARGHSARDRAQ